MPRRPVRRGITLIEVLVVIGIIGLLIALMLPAVSRNREAPRRNQCMNKMKLLAIALQNYHDIHKKLPATSNQSNTDGVASVWWPAPGSGAETGAIPSIGYNADAGSTSATAGYSWIVMILPHLDEANLYNAISDASGKFSADAFTPYNVAGMSAAPGRNFSITSTSVGPTIARHFAAIELDQLSCPSYSGSPRVAPSQFKGTELLGVGAGNPPAAYGFPSGSEKLGSPPQSAAITNYVALAATHFPLMQYGLEPNLAATTDVPASAEAPNGMIVPGVGQSMRVCTDGISRTLMLCETIEPAMNCWYDGTTTWTTAINPNTVGSYPPSQALCSVNPHGFWRVPEGGATALQVGPAPTVTIAYSPELAGYGATPQFISWGPSSNHSGGVVVHAAVDGSVHNITPDVDPTVYMHLITIAGGESDPLPDK